MQCDKCYSIYVFYNFRLKKNLNNYFELEVQNMKKRESAFYNIYFK